MSYDRTHFFVSPQRRIAGQAVLVHPDLDQVLMLDLVGRPCLWLPGGHAEADEPPHAAARRLVGIQLGIDVPFTGNDLALVDYSPASTAKRELEGYNFVFARTLSKAQAGMARPNEAAGPDLRAYRWCTLEDIEAECEPYHIRRISRAFEWNESSGSGASAPLMTAGALAT